MGLVLLIVFLDIVGFSILFPLYPDLLDHYVSQEGSESLAGRLAAKMAELAEGDPVRVTALFGGLLGSFYSVLQFLFAPFWGGLSDRIGRRPTLLVTLAGTVVGYLLWMFAGSFWVLVLSRLLCGIMAGNISTATAVVADVTSPKDRAKGMAMVGATIGLGFVFGPAIGGITIDALGWRYMFLIPLPVCAISLLAGANFLPGREKNQRPRRLDVRRR